LCHIEGLFVEEELLDSFAALIAFVQHSEAQMGSGGGEGQEERSFPDVDPATVETLVRDFAATWKKAIEAIYQNVLEYFSNFRNGMEILKQVLTQLLLYYTRFQDIIRRWWGRRQPPFSKDIVSTSSILVEIKKYSRPL
jgi:vacuolar protein sorting-associated protein 52